LTASDGGDDAACRAAQRLLAALFAAPGTDGVASLAAARWPPGAAGAAAREHAVAALAALPDVCAAPRGGAGGRGHGATPAPPPAALRHGTYEAALATAALAAAVARPDACTPFAAALLARLCRRGAAAAVADATLRLALQPVSASASAAANVVAALPDDTATSRLAEACLRALAASHGGGSSRADAAAERALRALLTRPLWRVPAVRLLLSERLLLRRTLPRPALRWLLRLVIIDPPAPPPPNEGENEDGSGAHNDNCDDNDTPLALRAEALSRLAATWASPEFTAGVSADLQAYATGALVACLRALPRGALDEVPGLMPALLSGVSARLGSAVPAARGAGMRVAAALSRAIADAAAAAGEPRPQLLFEEEEAAPPAPGDEWAGDLWAPLPCGDDDEADADAAAAAALDGEEAAASAPAGEAEEAAAATDAAAVEEEDDDPDAVFVPGRRAAARAPAARSESSYDSDDDEAAEEDGGALSPYELSDVEDEAADASCRGAPALLPGGSGAGGTALTSLRGLLEALRAEEPDTAEGALLAAEALIRAAPVELPPAAPSLASALLSARPPSADEERAAAARLRALTALAVHAPAGCLAALAPALLSGSDTLDVSQRLEILHVFAAAAEEMSAVTPPAPPTPPPGADGGAAGAMGALAAAGAATGAARRRGKTRLIAPVSLARRAAGRDGPPRGAASRFAPVAAAFFSPLLSLCGGGSGGRRQRRGGGGGIRARCARARPRAGDAGRLRRVRHPRAGCAPPGGGAAGVAGARARSSRSGHAAVRAPRRALRRRRSARRHAAGCHRRSGAGGCVAAGGGHRRCVVRARDASARDASGACPFLFAGRVIPSSVC
jgi:hypothetical protein